jgi:hypothetical protein
MAAEANFILQRQHATVILARQAAMREVRRRRQKLGLRDVATLNVARLGSEWLAAHPEPLVEAARSHGLDGSFLL